MRVFLKSLLIVITLISFITLTSCAEKECKHKFDLSEKKEATCIEDGYELYSCTKCGFTEKRNVQAALGHDIKDGTPKCLENVKCTRCGEEIHRNISDSMHDWELIEDRKATCDNEGYLHKICKECGLEVSKNIDAKGHNYDDKGYCKECSKFIYNIKVPNTPCKVMTLGNRECTRYTTMEISNITFESKRGSSNEALYVYFDCKSVERKNFDLYVLKFEVLEGEKVVQDYYFVLPVAEKQGIDLRNSLQAIKNGNCEIRIYGVVPLF